MQELFSKTIKVLSFLIIIGSFNQNLQAQIGITGTFTNIDAPNWQESMINSTRFDFPNDFEWSSSFKVGIDYTIKVLPETRLYIQPGISYSSFKEDDIFNTSTAMASTAAFNVNIIDASIPINLYFLDIEGDCDCPTFSKDGNVIKKGLFFQVSPGLTYTNNQIIQSINGSDISTNYTDISPNLGVGLGLDIGLSDYITITPLVRFTRHFNVEWESLDNNLNVEPSTVEQVELNTSPINQFEAGLRVEFRWKN